jgi:ABC-type cobalamin/Fe3+-siderophores transport system ATPase subunit
LFKETTVKTCVLGPRGIGKSYLLNTLLEATAPTEKEYAELNTEIQRPNVKADVKDLSGSTSYTFSSASETAYVPQSLQSVQNATSYPCLI